MSFTPEEEKHAKTIVILHLVPYLFIGGILLISFFKWLFSEKIDPMDNSIMARQEIVEHLNVVDSTRNGFRVVYVTVKNVTTLRLEEIKSRPPIKEGFREIQKSAPKHFGNLLETDIYAFAEFLIPRVPDKDIEIHNIFVKGDGKAAMYSTYNPDIPDCATWIDPETEQGMQYLSNIDIYNHRDKEKRVYRYWKCFRTSSTDERFSHFAEWERVNK